MVTENDFGIQHVQYRNNNAIPEGGGPFLSTLLCGHSPVLVPMPCTSQSFDGLLANISWPVDQVAVEASVPLCCTNGGSDDFTGGSLYEKQSDKDPIDDPRSK